MAENVDLNFISEQLKRVLDGQAAMRGDIDHIAATLIGIKTRMSAIEQHMLGVHLDIASLREGLDRIERRLELVSVTDAQP